MPRHNWRKLYAEWIGGGHTNLKEFSAAVKVPYGLVRQKAAKKKWTTKRTEIEQNTNKKVEEKIVESESDRIVKEREFDYKAGRMVKQDAVKVLIQNKPSSYSEALQGLKTGTDITRKALGMEDDKIQPVTNIQNNLVIQEITQLASANPGAREGILSVLRQLRGA
jgi:hypothetical protein